MNTRTSSGVWPGVNGRALAAVALLCAMPSMLVAFDSAERGAHGIARHAEDAAAAPQSEEVVSLTLEPATIAGGSGATATATVRLSVPAPAGGAVVTLSSSNIELAATLPRVVVPAGETTATFTVGTNPRYRAYSGLTFRVTISATLGSTRSATLTVTAQPRPADFTSGSTAGANTQWDGLMCGGIAPIGGRPGILYDCSPADATGFGTCTFRQECAQGCRRVPPNGTTYRDFCATNGPNPVALSRNYVVSGDRLAATIVSEAPAGQGVDQEVGSPATNDVNFNSIHVPFANGGIVFPDGATSVPFEVATSYVSAIQFVDVTAFWFNQSIPPLLITNGRAGQRWLVMVPPDPPPAVALPTLADFTITGLNPIVGGDSTFGQVSLSGISRAGGPTLTLTSSHPNIVPSKTFVAPVSETTFGFQAPIVTSATAADVDVTVTVSDGRYSFSDVLTVRAAPPPPPLADLSVGPTSVVGGNTAIGTVVLSAPQSDATVVQVSIIETAPASLPSNDAPCPPSSRCHNVVVPAGATTAEFTVGTSPVTSQFNLNIFAALPGSPGQQALLLITPGGATTPKLLSIDPTSVAGGQSATATVTLSAAAPAGGALVSLAKALANGGTGTVPVTIPPNLTIAAGQTSGTFSIATQSVTATTVVRISAAYNGVTANADMSLFAVLGQLSFTPSTVVGGTTSTGTVTLRSAAPSGGTVVTLASTKPSLAAVPANVTVPAGQTSATFTTTTSPVNTTTAVEVTASYGGVTVSGGMFLVVSRAVTSVTLDPSTVIGGASSTGRVTLRAAPTGNALVALASSNSLLAVVPSTVTVTAGQTSATFPINTASVTTTSNVVISASHENVTQSATLTITPSGTSTAALSSLSLNPANVTGGNTSTGTVIVSAAAPSGGAVVSLSSSNTAVSVPATVTVAPGATSATFAARTSTVTAQTNVTISAAYGGITRTAPLAVNPPSKAVTLTVTATGRSGERVLSSPAGISVNVGSTGSASFSAGTSITLSVSNGRDALWSGACSSGGRKTRTCTFTLNANASVSANVQ